MTAQPLSRRFSSSQTREENSGRYCLRPPEAALAGAFQKSDQFRRESQAYLERARGLAEAGRDAAPGEVPADIRNIFPAAYINGEYFWPGLATSYRKGEAPPFRRASTTLGAKAPPRSGRAVSRRNRA